MPPSASTPLWGFIDTSGELVIPPRFADTFAFSEGLAPAYVRDGVDEEWCGYIDRSGAFVIPPVYTQCDRFWYGKALVYAPPVRRRLILDRWGSVVDSTGIPDPDRRTSLTTNEVFVVENRRGYRDAAGRVIVPPVFDAVGMYVNDRALIKEGERYGFVDERGTVIVPPRYDHLSHFSEGLASFAVGGRWGVVDREGRVIVEPTYDYVGRFSHGMANVETGGRQGYIDARGNLVIPPTFTPHRRDAEFTDLR